MSFGALGQQQFQKAQQSGQSSFSYRSSKSSDRKASSMSMSSPTNRPPPYARPPSATRSRVEAMGESFSRSHNTRRRLPQCSTYGRPHFGRCKAEDRGCYNYGQEGHFKRDCDVAQLYGDAYEVYVWT